MFWNLNYQVQMYVMICKVEKGTALADMLLAYVEGCSWAEVKKMNITVIHF